MSMNQLDRIPTELPEVTYKNVWIHISVLLPAANMIEYYENALNDLDMGMFTVLDTDPQAHPPQQGLYLRLTVPDFTMEDDVEERRRAVFRDIADLELRGLLNAELDKATEVCTELLRICQAHGRDVGNILMDRITDAQLSLAMDVRASLEDMDRATAQAQAQTRGSGNGHGHGHSMGQTQAQAQTQTRGNGNGHGHGHSIGQNQANAQTQAQTRGSGNGHGHGHSMGPNPGTQTQPRNPGRAPVRKQPEIQGQNQPLHRVQNNIQQQHQTQIRHYFQDRAMNPDRVQLYPQPQNEFQDVLNDIARAEQNCRQLLAAVRRHNRSIGLADVRAAA